MSSNTEEGKLDTLFLVIGALGILYLYIKYKQTYWKRKGAPYLEPSILGNLKSSISFKQSIGVKMKELYFQTDKFKYFGIYTLTKPVLVIRDPEIIKSIFVKDFPYFQDHAFKVNETVDPLNAKNLFNCRGQKWKDLRVKLTPTFTSGKLKKMFYLMANSGKELNKFLHLYAINEWELEIKDVLSKFTTDVIAACAFGIKCNSIKDPNAEFSKIGKRILESSFTNGLRIAFRALSPKLADFLGLKLIPDKIANFFRNLVRHTMSYRSQHKIVRNDFMDLLMQLKEKGYVEDEENHQNGKTKNEIPKYVSEGRW